MTRQVHEGITLPTREELKELFEKNKQLLSWAQGLEAEQINYLFDGGWYNNTVKGYLIRAGQNIGLNREKINELLNGLRFALDEMSKQDADQTYLEY